MACDNCDWSEMFIKKKARPWQVEFWQTDCRLCLRIQGAALATILWFIIYGLI